MRAGIFDDMGRGPARARPRFPNHTQPTRTRETLSGVKSGVLFASVYSLAAVAIRLTLGTGLNPATSIDLGRSIAAYFAAGILGGAIFGYWRRSAKFATGRAMLSAVLGTLFSLLATAVLLGPPTRWDAIAYLSTGILATITAVFLFLRWEFFFET